MNSKIVEGVLPPVAPATTEQKLARKSELKAHGTLLMALPDKHQLKFNSHKDAKTLMEAIEKRFGGNTETKKVQKTLLKQHLPFEWKTHTLIWRNKADLEEQSLDDLLNNHKIYEAEVKHSFSTGTTTQNLAFVSSSNTDSTTESVSVVANVSAVCAKMPVSSLPNVDSLSRNLVANGPTSMGFDMSKVECYNCHMKGHFVRECRSSKDSRKNSVAEPQRRTVPIETSTSNALVSQCLESVEARHLVYKQSESVFEENIKLLNIEVQLRDNALVTLRQKLEKAEQERDDLKLKLENFQTSSKNLTELLASQTYEKTSLGYNSRVFTRAMFDYDDYLSSESDCERWPPTSLYDRFQPSDGYHAVPPPYIGTFMPPKPALVFNTAPTAVETDHSAFTIQLSPTKPEQPLSHTNRPTAPIIEDWVFDSKDESKTKAPQIVPSFVQSSKQVKSPRHYVQHDETSITAAASKPASPKPASSGKRRNGKACFGCKSMDHLIKDCDYHAQKMAQPTPRNHAHWSNHKQYAPLTHTNPQKHMVPAAVLTQSKPLSITAVRPVSAVVPKIKVHKSCDGYHAVPPPYTGTFMPPKPDLVFNTAPTIVETGHSTFTVQLSLTKPAQDLSHTNRPTTPIIKDWVSDSEDEYETKAPQIVPSFVQSSEVTQPRHAKPFVTKSKSPIKRHLTHSHSSKTSNSPPRVTAVKAPMVSTAQGNMSYLSDFKELNGGYVAFRGNPKGVKISGKGKIKTFIDDYSRFTWVFFLATKDGTRPILKTFITGLENQLSLKNNDEYAAFDGKEHDFDAKKPESEVCISPSSSAQSRKQDDKTKKEARGKSHVESFTGYRDLSAEFGDCSDNNINELNAAGTIVSTIGQNSSNNTNTTFSVAGPSNAATCPTYGKSSFIDASQLPDDPDMPKLEDITYSDDEDDVGTEADFNNLETSITVSPIPTTIGHKDHPVSQIIGDLYSTTQTRRNPRGYIKLPTIQVGLKLCRKSFSNLRCRKFWSYLICHMEKEPLVKQKKDGIFISQDKYVAEILRKFRLTEGKSTSTPIDTEKPLLKDPDGDDVDVHTYRSMIGSLMYLTSSRPDIMFVVCACVRF
nr:hypothetical protein [Tanacetum cinerariifolium]